MPQTEDAAREELSKRYSAAHKGALTRAAHHMNLAKAAHHKGMGFLAKAAHHMVESKKMSKAADGDTLAGHVAAAHDHFNTAGGHMDDALSHLGGAMSAWGHSTSVDTGTKVGGEINVPTLDQLTEGGAPWYDSAVPYGEKVAKAVQEALAKGGYVAKDAADKMVKDAEEKAAAAAKSATLEKQVELLSKQVETLQRMPAGAPRVKLFDLDKSALPGLGGDEPDDKLRAGALIEGVNFNMNDEGDFTKAASTMIANMVKNGPKFGKNLFGKAPMWDPTFHGRGGTGARN